MGIPGLLKEIGKGERVALSKLAIEHLERRSRPLRIAIDASIWNFQLQSSQGGKNPALRAFFYRLLRLLALPIQPVFVYDGKRKPLTKRGRTVTRYNGSCMPNEQSKDLVARFCFPWHVAPGEAEAECAFLQRNGLVDMVMSQDVDAIMFGAGVTLRDWSKEGTRGNKTPTHVNVIDAVRLKEISGLDSDGMILVALLSGGDYDENGVSGFGPALACEIARAGFGRDLIELVNAQDWDGLGEWRERLRYELETNESGYLKRKHKALHIPDTFPDLKILGYYTNPAVSTDQDLPELETRWSEVWRSEINVPALRAYTATAFEWCWKTGARHFVRCFAQPIFQDRLSRGAVSAAATFTTDNISERRQHFINDGIPELRLSAVPAEVVAIDISAEEDNPHYITEQVEENEAVPMDVDAVAVDVEVGSQPLVPTSPSKRKKSPPWDPYVSEKWWIPETLLQLGLPEIVEGWHQLQRDVRADPKKFAARKAAKGNKVTKQIDTSMKAGAIHDFFTKAETQTQRKDVTIFEKSHNVVPRLTAMLRQNKTTGENTSREGDSDKTHREQILRISNTPNTDQISSQPNQKMENFHNPLDLLQSSTAGSVNNLSESYKSCSENDKDFGNGSELVLDRAFEASSISAAIQIDSSPVPTKPSSVIEPPLSSQDVDHVTRRRPRKGKIGSGKTGLLSPTSPNRARRPIESFFPQMSQSDLFGNQSALTAGASTLVHPSPPLLSSSDPISKSKSRPLTRPSLPGAWKEDDGKSVLSKRGSRISHIDLTID